MDLGPFEARHDQSWHSLWPARGTVGRVHGVVRRYWTILLGMIVLSAGLLWMVFGREPIREGRCRLVRKKADPESQLLGLAFQLIRPADRKPDQIQDLPAGFEQPRYYEIKSGNRPILMAADFSQKHVRLCIDTDGDGILSEERCFTARLRKETPVSGSKQQIGPVALVSADGAARTDGAFYVNCYRQDARGLLIPFPAFFRTGKLRLAGQTYRVAVVDGDHDGQFSSILSLPLDRPWRMPACDVFAVDSNHNGEFEISSFARSEVRPLGRLVQVDAHYYSVDVAPDGKSLTLVKTEPELGTLAIESGDAAAELKLWSDAADRYLPPGHQWQLPVGKYMAIYATLEQTDASGHARTLSWKSSSANLGPLNFFEIKPGETTSVKIGPPFTLKTSVQQAGPGEVAIDALLVGCAGEEYQVGWRGRGGAVPEPAFKIVNEKGTVLVADKFQYG